MTMCGATRLLVPAALVGVVVASLSGHDLYGLVAAVLTAGVLALVDRVRGITATCAVAPPAVERRVEARQVHEDGAGLPSPSDK